MTNYQPERLDRIEASLEPSTQLLERVIGVQGTMLTTQEQQEQRLGEHREQIASNEAMIAKLDAVLERMVYREGRSEES